MLDTVIQGPTIGRRHLQVFNICILVFVAYYARNNMSVAIVAMTDSKASSNSDIQTFNWTNKNIVLSSFFMGYVPFQMGTGWLIPRVNIKQFAIISIAVSSILGLLIPLTAEYIGAQGVIAIRILQGTTQGFVFPLAQYLLARWVPPKERSVLGGAVYAARPVATVLAMLIPGYIAASSWGWPWIFYSSNILALFWCVSFGIFSYERPSVHPTISLKEKKYIELSIGEPIKATAARTPFKQIFTSPPFYALTVAAIGYVWGFWTMQSQMPMYLNYVMKFNISSSGAIAALPYLMQFLASYVFSFISDYLLVKNVWKIGTARKTMNSIGTFVPAVTLVIFQYTNPEDTVTAIFLLTIAIATTGACFCGYTINHMDLSPNHSSFLVGISNGLAQSCGFLAPIFVQAVVHNESDSHDWHIVFYATSVLNVIAGLIFVLFGSGEVQYWNNLDNRRNESEPVTEDAREDFTTDELLEQ